MSSNSDDWETYQRGFLAEGVRFLCGQFLGSGISRAVYEYGGNADYVVKVEIKDTGRFQNSVEWNMWHEVEGKCKQAERWLAPCIRISPNAIYMIQIRTMPLSLVEIKKKVPKVPIWLCDTKVGNWGRLPNGKIVCHDYGTHQTTQHGINGKMKKADWWE